MLSVFNHEIGVQSVKKIILLCSLFIYSFPCYAQSAVDSGIGFHPFRHIISRMTEGAVISGAGYGAYRYNQAGRNELNQVVYSSLIHYGTSEGRDFERQINSILQHHKIMGKHNLSVIVSQIVSQEPKYQQSAIGLLNDFGISSNVLYNKIQQDKVKNIQNVANENKVIKTVEAEEESCPIDATGERNKMGIATGGENLSYITDTSKWFHGTSMQVALIPKQVADDLRGHVYKNFDGLRSDIWKTVYKYPVLRNYFISYKDKNNKMMYGYAPFVKNGQNVVSGQDNKDIKDIKNLWRYPDNFEKLPNPYNISNVPDTSTMEDVNLDEKNGNTRYQIHHIIPIGRGGEVYNFNNLVIVTPLYHCSMLEYKYHQGGGKKQ